MFCFFPLLLSDFQGYFSRVLIFRSVIDRFIAASASFSNIQVINIGCGYDAVSFHLMEKGIPDLISFEVDYPDIIRKKAQIIFQTKELREIALGDGDFTGQRVDNFRTDFGYSFGRIKLISADLHSPQKLVNSLRRAGLISSAPTLIMSECVLVCTFI